MPVQKNVDIVRRLVGRNVLKTEFQSTADKINDQWPFEIAVAISANDSDSGSNRAKLIENGLHTNISKMPDFVCTLSQFLHVLRQAIVRVRQDENAQHLFGRGFFLVGHVKQSLAQFDPEWVKKLRNRNQRRFASPSLADRMAN